MHGKTLVIIALVMMSMANMVSASDIDYIDYTTHSAGDGFKATLMLFDVDGARIVESGTLDVIYYSDVERKHELFRQTFNINSSDFSGSELPSLGTSTYKWISPRTKYDMFDTSEDYYDLAEFTTVDGSVFTDLPFMPDYPFVFT